MDRGGRSQSLSADALAANDRLARIHRGSPCCARVPPRIGRGRARRSARRRVRRTDPRAAGLRRRPRRAPSVGCSRSRDHRLVDERRKATTRARDVASIRSPSRRRTTATKMCSTASACCRDPLARRRFSADHARSCYCATSWISRSPTPRSVLGKKVGSIKTTHRRWLACRCAAFPGRRSDEAPERRRATAARRLRNELVVPPSEARGSLITSP